MTYKIWSEGPHVSNACNPAWLHNLIAVPTKIKISRRKPKEIVHRSYIHFEEETFIYDIECIPFHVIEVFDDNDHRYWAYNNLLSNFVNTHAPMKKGSPLNLVHHKWIVSLEKPCIQSACLTISTGVIKLTTNYLKILKGKETSLSI